MRMTLLWYNFYFITKIKSKSINYYITLNKNIIIDLTQEQ